MSALEKAQAAWGEPLPDWVEALAREADATSQAKTARLLDYSGALISQVLHNRYPGHVHVVEETVRAIIMGAEVSCPALGQLSLSDCRAWRQKAENFVSANAQRVRMYRACNRCPLFQKGEADGQ